MTKLSLCLFTQLRSVKVIKLLTTLIRYRKLSSRALCERCVVGTTATTTWIEETLELFSVIDARFAFLTNEKKSWRWNRISLNARERMEEDNQLALGFTTWEMAWKMKSIIRSTWEFSEFLIECVARWIGIVGTLICVCFEGEQKFFSFSKRKKEAHARCLENLNFNFTRFYTNTPWTSGRAARVSESGANNKMPKITFVSPS